MIYVLIVVLFLLMTMIGGERGTKSFMALILNVLIGLGSLYLIPLGIHPLIVMVASATLFSLVTIVYQNGWNPKTISSLIAIGIVILITSVLIYVICTGSHISGFSEIEIQEEDTPYLSAAVPFKMRYLLLLSLVWCQLGAISDTSMAISSALNEIHLHHPGYTLQELYHEGMVVGKDILGTTINTLFFVSLGESIMLFLYYETYRYSFTKLMNSASFVQDMFPVLLPCIGCLIIIPLTALIYAFSQKRDTHMKHGDVQL